MRIPSFPTTATAKSMRQILTTVRATLRMVPVCMTIQEQTKTSWDPLSSAGQDLQCHDVRESDRETSELERHKTASEPFLYVSQLLRISQQIIHRRKLTKTTFRYIKVRASYILRKNPTNQRNTD